MRNTQEKVETVDIYVKDEGYASIRFLTKSVKKWASEAKIPNTLDNYKKDGFCGQPIFIKNKQDGLYRIACGKRDMNNIIKHAKKAGFAVDSEL